MLTTGNGPSPDQRPVLARGSLSLTHLYGHTSAPPQDIPLALLYARRPLSCLAPEQAITMIRFLQCPPLFRCHRLTTDRNRRGVRRYARARVALADRWGASPGPGADDGLGWWSADGRSRRRFDSYATGGRDRQPPWRQRGQRRLVRGMGQMAGRYHPSSPQRTAPLCSSAY